MNIREVETRQFAGIRDKKIELDNGLNIIVGDNETGKSTMVELINQLLFRNSALKRTTDRDFYTKFMPTGSSGDFVEGTLKYSTADGEYTLKRKWGKGNHSELTDPSKNLIGDEATIHDILKKELSYEQGLYNDVVFPSQKNEQAIALYLLKALRDAPGAKQDLVSIIANEGMTVTGEIKPEDIEKIINDKLQALGGRWDFNAMTPEKRKGYKDPWKQGKGTILDAHYKYEELEDTLRKAEAAEKAVEQDNINIQKAKDVLGQCNHNKDEYDSYAEILATYKQASKLKESYEDTLRKISAALREYPEALSKLADATILKQLLEARDVVNLYKKIKDAELELRCAKEALELATEVTEEELKKVASRETEIVNLKAKLSNLDLVATIKELGRSDIKITSLASGKEIDISSGSFEITDAIEISIPGILCMTIAGKDVDVSAIQDRISILSEERDRIFVANGVKDLAELKSKKADYDRLVKNKEIAKIAYDNAIGNTDIKALEDNYAKCKDKEAEFADLDDRLASLCGREDIKAFIGRQQQKIDSIEAEYGAAETIDTLEKSRNKTKADIKALEEKIALADNIPPQYLSIEDVEAFKRKLSEAVKVASEALEGFRQSLRESERALGDIDLADLRLQIADSKAEFDRLLDEYKKWNHILEVLKTVRANISSGSTIQDVRDRFAEYLKEISGGRLVLEDMNDEMSTSIKSGNNALTADILSEGTKDTIALAFRLAMLEHLFPDGGGIVVLDDPFTEMDETRTGQSCKLVQKFADAGNQVIFVTCDKKYENLLNGKVIEFQ